MSNMPALYQLTAEYLAVQEKLSNMDLDEQVIKDTLESLQAPIEQKAAAVVVVMRNFEAVADSIKKAEADMAERRKAYEKRAQRLHDYVRENMEHAGIFKIESPQFALTLKKKPQSVEIFDYLQLPPEYFRIPETPEPQPDKKMIGDDLKALKDVPGARLSVPGYRLEIK